MSAAAHADVLFVKQKPYGENDLAAYCVKNGIKHILFEDFEAALAVEMEQVNKLERLEAEAKVLNTKVISNAMCFLSFRSNP